MSWATSVPILVGLLAATAALVGAMLARRHDRQQQARVLMIAPAESFSRATLAALAALRHVTPPSTNTEDVLPHRNDFLLTSVDVRNERLAACHDALDQVRIERAHVRLMFHPSSWSAEWSRRVLAHLRHCIQDAERFYMEHDASVASGDERLWQSERREPLRDSYKSERAFTYAALDEFFDDVAVRLIRPTWNPRRIPVAVASRTGETAEHGPPPAG